ncbi:MAG: hypothetical protein EA426_09810 [Spirochaetaceae bacterium]|nr:MAG: hypothetical protein EA426_09810 [Spirochaetaceae bacterium]
MHHDRETRSRTRRDTRRDRRVLLPRQHRHVRGREEGKAAAARTRAKLRDETRREKGQRDHVRRCHDRARDRVVAAPADPGRAPRRRGVTIIGLDVGTTGCKAIAFNPDGAVLARAYREYDIIHTADGGSEQDAEAVYRATCACLTEITAAVPAPYAAIAASVQGDAIIPVDEDFRAIGNTYLGMDMRPAPIAEEIATRHGSFEMFSQTGMRPHAMNSGVKMVQLARSSPDLSGRAVRIVTYADFITGRLTGEATIDRTMASRTMVYDVAADDWSTVVLKELGIDRALLSRVVGSGLVVGEVRPNASRETGIPVGTPVVSGGHDQCCAALGAGVVRPGIGVASTGTAEVLSTAFAEPRLDRAMHDAYFPCYRHVLDPLYFTFSLNHVGGILLKWFRDTIATEEKAEAGRSGADAYDVIFRAAPGAPTGMFVLPHFNGSGTPMCDPASRGAIVGLTLATGRAEIAKAIIESLTFELKLNVETMKSAGIVLDEIRAVGGGARSAMWLAIKASVLGVPVATLESPDAAALGAAILAGSAVGVYASPEDGVAATVRIGRMIEPGPDSAEYAALYERYTTLYERLKGL